MVQKKDLKKVEWGGTAEHKPSHREGGEMKNLSPQGRWGAEYMQVATFSLTQQFVTQGSIQMVFDAAGTHVSAVFSQARV